jgi:hypothetical protein
MNNLLKEVKKKFWYKAPEQRDALLGYVGTIVRGRVTIDQEKVTRLIGGNKHLVGQLEKTPRGVNELVIVNRDGSHRLVRDYYVR